MKGFSVNINEVSIRVNSKSSKNGPLWRYQFRYPPRRSGKVYRGTLGNVDMLTRPMIKKMLSNRIQEIAKGPVIQKVLISEAIQRYMERHAVHLARKGHRERQILAGFKQHIGDRPVDEITIESIEDYVTWRSSSVLPTSVNREMTVIRSMFGKAMRWGLCKSNPTKDIKKLREGPGRVRYLIGDEWTRLEKAVKAGPWWLYPACILAREAGLRKGEILRLTWADIDMGNALMRVKNTKAGRSEVIPLNSSVMEMLWQLSRNAEHIIHTKNKTPVGARNLCRAWAEAVKKADILDLRFHDLRHDFASRLVMAGSGIEAAKVLLRHADLRMAARYAHLSPGYLREAVEAINCDTPVIVG